MSRLSRNSGSLKLLQISEPVQTCSGIALRRVIGTIYMYLSNTISKIHIVGMFETPFCMQYRRISKTKNNESFARRRLLLKIVEKYYIDKS